VDVTEILRLAQDDINKDVAVIKKTFWWQEKWEVAGLLQPVSHSITGSNTPGGRSVCSLGKTVGFD
jgi:hypothetical protein